MPTASGPAIRSAPIELTSVPTRKSQPPYRSVTGFQDCSVMKPRPNCEIAGRARSMTFQTMASNSTTARAAPARLAPCSETSERRTRLRRSVGAGSGAISCSGVGTWAMGARGGEGARRRCAGPRRDWVLDAGDLRDRGLVDGQDLGRQRCERELRAELLAG